MRFLGPRATPGVEQATPECYRRTMPGGWLEVRPGADDPNLKVTVAGSAGAGIVARLHGMFDTAAPVREIERHLKRSSRLAATVRRESGLRIPGAWDAFELT